MGGGGAGKGRREEANERGGREATYVAIKVMSPWAVRRRTVCLPLRFHVYLSKNRTSPVQTSFNSFAFNINWNNWGNCFARHRDPTTPRRVHNFPFHRPEFRFPSVELDSLSFLNAFTLAVYPPLRFRIKWRSNIASQSVEKFFFKNFSIPEIFALICKYFVGKGGVFLLPLSLLFLYDSRVKRRCSLFSPRQLLSSVEVESIRKSKFRSLRCRKRLTRSFLPIAISNYEFTSHGGIIGGKW